ncbi:MAG: methyltransferase [Elusimicrobiales bacterium]|nr:methyltransferase [Elusimicrobiales bacterium]
MATKEKLSAKTILEMVRGFQPACVVIAGADLDVFSILHARPMNAGQLAAKIKGDLRATRVLLDALAALGLLNKGKEKKPVYRVPREAAGFLTEKGPHCVLGMLRHLGTCLRRWGDLAGVVLSGKPAARRPSVRGAEGDLDSFIRAMHEVSQPMSEPLISSLGPLKFSHLLDLGGASGTWTIPFLRLNPEARATIFDLPEVVPMARLKMKKTGFAERIKFVGGSYHKGEMPKGADLAWVSAIVHQNSRAQNRAMFEKVFKALEPGGRILIRDIIVDSTRTRPVGGALFAVNMLVGTEGGDTFTFEELREDLVKAGFGEVEYLRRGQMMDSVICAAKPVRALK